MRVESSGVSGLVPESSSEAVLGTASPSAGGVADELARDRADVGASAGTSTVWRAHSEVRPAALPAASALHGAAHAIVEGGVEGFDAYLEAHPDAARELALGDRAMAETALAGLIGDEIGGPRGALTGFWQADAALDHFEESLAGDIRETVRSTATMAIDEQIAVLDQIVPDAFVAAVRDAEPGSELAEMGERLGVRGDWGDTTRVRSAVRDAREALTELRGTIAGGTWSPEELPGTTRRVMDAMGFSDAPEGSMAEAAFHRPEVEAASVAHYAEMAADAAYSGFEVVEASHAGLAVGGGAALPFAVLVGGVLLGLAIHHNIEENRMERTEVARHFGL